MTPSDEQVRRAALLRLAAIFRVSVEDLSPDARFGEELRESFVSNFRANELDQINNDIRDVSNKQTLRELESGARIIRTVGDYCDHMTSSYRSKPDEVIHLLRLG